MLKSAGGESGASESWSWSLTTSSSRMESRLSINQTGTPLERHTPDLTITQLPTADRTADKRLELSLPGIQVLRVQTMLPAPRTELSLIHGSYLDKGGQAAIPIAAFSHSLLLANYVPTLQKPTLPSVQGWCRNTSRTTD